MSIELDLPQARTVPYLRLKRAADVAASLLILIFLSPLLAVVSMLVMLTSGRPVVFKQQRIGTNGKPFVIYKFRTMKPAHLQVAADNQAKTDYSEWTDGVPDDFVFKSGFNPNVTKIGAFLRKTSIDELPQFFNVLKGDMSIIGPRPEVPQITGRYSALQRQRLLVKPGITGWAQVNGRSLIPHGDKIKYDLHYVHHFSLKMDIRIIIKTIQIVLFNKGAF
jgi:lipopolysaccharide/colanic/teichoic acid biosynthesis glycosyltransferase